jgi:hypothetical protein
MLTVAAEMPPLKAASIAKWASPPPRDGSAAPASKKRKVDAKPIKADTASKAKGPFLGKSLPPKKQKVDSKPKVNKGKGKERA